MSDEKNRDAGRFLVRMPDGMRERIAEEAKANSRSMNAEIVHRLEESFGLMFPLMSIQEAEQYSGREPLGELEIFNKLTAEGKRHQERTDVLLMMLYRLRHPVSDGPVTEHPKDEPSDASPKRTQGRRVDLSVSPYEEGQQAFRDGGLKARNPYTDSAKAGEWDQGLEDEYNKGTMREGD